MQAIVFVTLDAGERLRRLRLREELRGEGVDEGFLEWAAAYDDPGASARSRTRHEAWLADHPQPVLRLDSTGPTAELVEQVLTWAPRT